MLLFVLVLLLAFPAASFAGSATSRWDLTIGGYVKVDAGYTSQAAGPSPAGLEEYFAAATTNTGSQNSLTRRQLRHGHRPDGAELPGQRPGYVGREDLSFYPGHFVGQTNNNGYSGTRYGTFTLTHAYADFTWANTKLIVGQNWQSWGFLPTYNFIGLYDLLLSGRGNTVPQITLIQNFSKSFYASFGIQEPYNMKDQIGGSATRAQPRARQNTTVGQNTATVRVTTRSPT